MGDASRIESLEPGLVEALERAGAYPGDAGAAHGIQHIQTHLSHVFLTRGHVYKIHKAVRFPFVDFGLRSARNEDSLRELRLNRRLAPEIYLGLAPVETRGGAVRIGATRESLAPAGDDGAVPEHCVVMVRLSEGRDALSLLQRGELGPGQIDAIAEVVANFHRGHGLGTPAPWSAAEWLERIGAPVRESFSEIADAAALATRGRAALARAEDFLAGNSGRFEARRQAGRAVDAHGDLHLQHVWFERAEGPPLAIDCLEFRSDYREIDAASEVAFLAMDLAYRGRRDLGERFLRRYAEAMDDYDLYGVVDFFIAYRAAVRAKVAALASRDAGVPESQREAAAASAERHLTLAETALAEPAPGAVVALAGMVGTGKSTVARALADDLGGVVIASDRVRKRQAKLADSARGHGELYTDERTDRTYAGLRERALPVLRSGRTAILDATYARAALRGELLRWVAKEGIRAFLVETTCAAPVALARLEARARAGTDPSDAGPELYEASARGYESPAEWPADARASIATDAPSWRADVIALARRIAAGAIQKTV
ncbi:MAG TPA: AAA family ATPase [Myxococcota bacterium]|nr:AAA family ATPase [Myxococcota bacterium]